MPKKENGKVRMDEEKEELNGDDDDAILNFNDMGLDERLLYAIEVLGWSEPTAIQETAIPIILEGKDVLAQARTGSGKTGAYMIPLIHKILRIKKQTSQQQCTIALILAPSRELCQQIMNNLSELCEFCKRELNFIDLAFDLPVHVQRSLLAAKHDIIVSTPSKILQHLQNGNLKVNDTLEMLIIDEADLLLSFGYQSEMSTLINYLPKTVQTILLSATLNDDVNMLKKLYLHNAALLKLKENDLLPSSIQLEQYQINCNDEEDKYVILYSILKLNLIRGKSIIFVNTVNRCYKLKLFLEQFGIRSCVLNSELPLNSRMHIIEQFNGGLYDSIIASDERLDSADKREENGKDDAANKKANKKKDKEYNISRGIDFKHVSNVINFDFPLTTKSYVHRVGRTARGNLHGIALSFVDTSEESLIQAVDADLNTNKNEETRESIFKVFQFKMDEIEGFRYRARDVLRSITSVAIKEARLKEIKNELLNSEKLKVYFDENPREAQMLRHDKELHVTKIQEHLKHVPEYIIPPSLRGLPVKASASNSKDRRNQMKRLTKGQMQFKKKSSDPLQSFQFKAAIRHKKKFNKK